jgi:hypothetical protein
MATGPQQLQCHGLIIGTVCMKCLNTLYFYSIPFGRRYYSTELVIGIGFLEFYCLVARGIEI